MRWFDAYDLMNSKEYWLAANAKVVVQIVEWRLYRRREMASQSVGLDVCMYVCSHDTTARHKVKESFYATDIADIAESSILSTYARIEEFMEYQSRVQRY